MPSRNSMHTTKCLCARLKGKKEKSKIIAAFNVENLFFLFFLHFFIIINNNKKRYILHTYIYISNMENGVNNPRVPCSCTDTLTSESISLL